jgi:hypothetical protein
MKTKLISAAILTAAMLATPVMAANNKDHARGEQQPLSAAMQCSKAALVRYATSSTETADKVADAAFYICKDLWKAYVAAVGSDLTESAALNYAREGFVGRAVPDVFEIRAKAKGGADK